MEEILEKIMKKKKLYPKAINALKAKYQILNNQYYDIKGYREPVKNIRLDELIKGIYKDRDLSNLDFSDSYLENYKFINCKIKDANFENGMFKKVVFKESDIVDSNFKNSNFEKVYFNHTTINKSNFENAKFISTIYVNSPIQYSNFKNTYWEKSVINLLTTRSTDWNYVYFRESIIANSTLSSSKSLNLINVLY